MLHSVQPFGLIITLTFMLGRRPRNRRRSTGDVNQRRQQPQPHPTTPDLASTTATAPGLTASWYSPELRAEANASRRWRRYLTAARFGTKTLTADAFSARVGEERESRRQRMVAAVSSSGLGANVPSGGTLEAYVALLEAQLVEARNDTATALRLAKRERAASVSASSTPTSSSPTTPVITPLPSPAAATAISALHASGSVRASPMLRGGSGGYAFPGDGSTNAPASAPTAAVTSVEDDNGAAATLTSPKRRRGRRRSMSAPDADMAAFASALCHAEAAEGSVSGVTAATSRSPGGRRTTQSFADAMEANSSGGGGGFFVCLFLLLFMTGFFGDSVPINAIKNMYDLLLLQVCFRAAASRRERLHLSLDSRRSHLAHRRA